MSDDKRFTIIGGSDTHLNVKSKPIPAAGKIPCAVALAVSDIALVAVVLVLLVLPGVGGHDGQAASEDLFLTPSPTPTPPHLPSLNLLWKADMGNLKAGTLTQADGTLYVIVMGGAINNSGCRDYHGGWCYHLQALDSATGKLKWSLEDYEYPPTVA